MTSPMEEDGGKTREGVYPQGPVWCRRVRPESDLDDSRFRLWCRRRVRPSSVEPKQENVYVSVRSSGPFGLCFHYSESVRR